MRGDIFRRQKERGQVLVLVALLVPLLLAIGSIVIDVGNWYVLKRHLQTQVDAAALAGGPAFTGCFQNPTGTTAAISQQALAYAGDRDTFRGGTSAHNQLMQDTADVHAVLNSNTWWSDGDPSDGVGLDWTAGMPCDTKFLDVKATDDDAPLLWKWIPFFPDIKTRARVEVTEIKSTGGLRPLGVPENDPKHVAVLIVDEADGSIKGSSELDPQSTPPTGLGDMSVWSKDFISPVDLSGDRDFGVIIVASRSTIDLNQSLSQICSPGSGQVECYGGATPSSGISFIHAYSATGTGGAGTPPPDPIIRGVTLDGGCAPPSEDLSRPYFNLEGGCPITIDAQIDFGTGSSNPVPRASSGGVCARVSSPQVQGGQLTWSGGVWTGTVNAAADGPTPVTLSWDTDTVGNCGGPGGDSGSLGKVAEPYAADEASGPVQYLTVERSGGLGFANSIARTATASLKVTVGLSPPLREGALSDPAIRLRFSDEPSHSKALACDPGASDWNAFMVSGCPDAYQIYDDSKHPLGKCDPWITSPADCIRAKKGNKFQQKAVADLLSPCAANPNRWDGMNIPPAWDKRWMPLFVLDQMAFEDSNEKTFPIRRFGMFYITGVAELDCPDEEPPLPPGDKTKAEIWGHFMSFVTPGFGQTIPSNVPCSFGNGTLCVSNLVE